jgi:hypothetical protein
MNIQAINMELTQALRDLQKELRSHVRMDVKKHYSLMVADVQASKAIDKATSIVESYTQHTCAACGHTFRERVPAMLLTGQTT